MLDTREVSLKGIRAGNGMVYSCGVNSICQKFPEARRSREDKPPFYSSLRSFFTLHQGLQWKIYFLLQIW